MMKTDPIQRLWELKRTLPNPASTDDTELPPGMATRIASRWAHRTSNTGLIWERVTAGALVVTLLICGTAAWLRPDAKSQDDMMLSLFRARPAPAHEFPF